MNKLSLSSSSSLQHTPMEIDSEPSKGGRVSAIAGATLQADSKHRVSASPLPPITVSSKKETSKEFEEIIRKLYAFCSKDEFFSEPEFDLVTSFLRASLSKTFSEAGIDPDYAIHYEKFVKEFNDEFVQDYLKICMDSLPESMLEQITDNVAKELLFCKNFAPNTFFAYQHVFSVCEYTTHASIEQLFAACAMCDSIKIESCIENLSIEQLGSFNSAEYRAFEYADNDTLKSLELEGLASLRLKNATPTVCWPFKTQLQFDALKNGDEQAVSEEYVANYVLDGRGVAAEGPQADTVNDFWQLVAENGIHTIVKLSGIFRKFEGFVEQCCEYFPREQGTECTFGKLKVKNIKTNECYKSGLFKIIERHLMLTGVKEPIQHFEVLPWPDMGVIFHKDLYILANIAYALYHKNKDWKILAHCKAGKGRTGAFFAALETLIERRKGNTKRKLVFNVVNKLRSTNPDSVLTIDQYNLVIKMDKIDFSALYIKHPKSEGKSSKADPKSPKKGLKSSRKLFN